MPRLDGSARFTQQLAHVLVACVAGSACAGLLVAVGVRARGALSEDGVSVDDGGAVISQTRPFALQAVLDDVLGRVSCDPPSPSECEDPDYMQEDCGLAALRTIRQTGTSPCAESCFVPTRGDCEDEAYIATLCGQLEIKRGQVPIHPDCADENALTTCPPSPSVCRNILFAEGADLQQSEGSILPDAPFVSAVVPSSAGGGAGLTPLERVSLAQNGYAAPEVTSVVRRADPDFSDFETSGPGSLYSSRVLEEAVAGQSEFPTLSQELILLARESVRQDWADNGNAVAECAEYVYEKYYGYTVFEDQRVAPGMTPREAWEIAYADDGSDAAIGARGMQAETDGVPLELRQKDGTLLPLEITFPRGPQPKNEFFSTPIITGALRQNILDDFNGEAQTYRFKLFGAVESDIVLPRPVFGITGFDGIVLLDDDLNARIQNAAPIEEGWTYHYDRGVELGANQDEQMLAYEQMRAAFVPLLTRWATLAQEANNMLKSLLPRGEVEVNDQLFDPSIYENVARTSSVTAVSRLSSVRGARDSERAIESGTPLSENSGLLSSLAPQSFLSGLALTQLLSPASGAGGSVTPMSGSFGLSLDRVSEGRLLDADVLAALEPLMTENAMFFARLRTVLLQLAVVSGDIEAALLDARDRECLEDTVKPCDWSPRSFLQRVSDQFEAQRERDFQRCLLTTYDFFDSHQLSEVVPGRFLVDFAPGPNKPRTEALQNGTTAVCDDGPYDTSPTRFENWQSCFRAWRRDMLAALATQLAGGEQLVNPETGVVEPSETAGDQQQTGDDMFAMDFEYDVDWRLTGLPDVSEQARERWCSLEPQVHGRAEVDGKLLGFDMELADVGIYVDTSAGAGADNEAYVEIGGEEIIAVQSTAGEIDISRYNLIFEETTTNSYELFSFSQTFPVGPVWVNVTAGAAGIFGAHLLGAAGRLAEQGGDCAAGDLGLEGKLIPYVGFQGFASASLDYLVVEAGVKIALTLIQLSFPFNVSLTFSGKPQAGNPDGIDTDLKVTNSLDMVLSLLDGRVAAFVEVCFILCEEFEATLFEWQGIRWVVNLFHTELSMPLGTLVQFQQQLLEDGFTAAGN